MSTASTALAPRVLAMLSDLELVARVTVDGTIAGLHRSPFHGFSAEFSQYRPYRAGDDLKYVDWKLFARSDRFYTKQFRETTNLPAQLAFDASASMGYAGESGVSKLAYARLLAAAVAHLLQQQGDGVGLTIYDDGVRRYLPSRTGRSHLRALLVALSQVEAAGRSAGAVPLKRAAELLKRRGLLCIFSDLYDDDHGIDAELRRALGMGHEVAVFHVLTREELLLRLPDEAEVQDLETGATLVVRAPQARADYVKRMQVFVDAWRTRCVGYGVDYTLAVTDMRLDEVLKGYLLRRAATPAR